jgi:steroid 5-alpha reductase family enzyme
MSPLLQTCLTTFAVVTAMLVGLWLVSLRTRDVGIVDPFWGTGFAVTAWLALALNGPAPPRIWLLAGLTTAWGVRLSLYLLYRNWGREEDRRYAKMREHHGPRFWWVSLFTVFLLQAGILWFVSLPVQVAAVNRSSSAFGWLDAAGGLLWGIGLFFETVGDWQMARFQADPDNRGKVMDRGLWRYSRHPNYFGDFCVWWGLYLFAASGGAFWTIVSPLLMSVLLLRVSGVSLLESTIAERRPNYADYQRRTSAFFPMPPK